MKSIVNEALARHEGEKKKEDHMKETITTRGQDDQELEKLVDTLAVSIKIIGCGGGGSNTINRLTQAGVVGADLCAINTDAKHLLSVHSPRKILVGRRATKGLGAGALPEVGEQAVQENEEELRNYLEGSNVAFITAGMGGGTGTGSAPYVARMAKDEGALVMGVVTMPFKAEGNVRMQNAEAEGSTS